MAQRYADLEIGFRWLEDVEGLDVGLRFVLSDENVDDWVHLDEPLKLDLGQLARRVNNQDAYARELTRMIFRQDEIAKFYSVRRARAQDRPIHLRLNLDVPPAVHRVRWELLRDPDTDLPLAITEDVLFSRYLSHPDYRVIPWRSRRATRALVVIANPSDLGTYAPQGRRLAEVRVDAELSNAEAALKGFEQIVYLARRGQATLPNIARELANEIDILYLVCHGSLPDDVPVLFLEKADGTVDLVDGRRLQEVIFSLPRRPTLAVLNSCQSAAQGGAASTADEGPSTGDRGILAGLGPRLAGAGIAAVIAMQGDVTMESAQRFTKRFFTELQRDGLIDRSVAAARRELRENGRPDWWVPVLFSRLRTGRSYFKAEFTGDGEAIWEKLRSSQSTGRLTPVLGPGMTDEILGSRQAIAQRWTEQWQMPIMAHNQEDLAKVAQFLRVQQKAPGDVATRVAEYLKEEIAGRIDNAANAPDDPFHGLDPQAEPGNAIMTVGKRLLERDPGNAYRVVAGIPAPIFVTTNWTLLLEQALRHRNPPRKPTTMYFPWNARAEWPEPSRMKKQPTADAPLVYHLFGRMEDPDSLVLTEDDYFEWLTAWVAKQSLVPEAVVKNLINRPLLFLGYRLDVSIQGFLGETVTRHVAWAA